MTALPYGNTTIPATKSIGDIMELLQSVGFDRTMQMFDNGRYVVMGQYKGIQYRWEAQTKGIRSAIEPKRWTAKTIDYDAKARRVAWRVLWYQIKVACDILKYEVQDVTEIFGGHLVYFDQDGKETTLARMITERAKTGEFKLPQIEAPK